MDSNGLQDLIATIIYLAIYAYFALCLYMMANKVKVKNSWLAWIPILNFFTFVDIAKKSYWYVLLLFIPLVNIVAIVYLWMMVAKRLHKPEWVGLLMLVPGINLVLPAYLAFSE